MFWLAGLCLKSPNLGLLFKQKVYRYSGGARFKVVLGDIDSFYLSLNNYKNNKRFIRFEKVEELWKIKI